jgi:hypothetical protein
MAPTTHSSSSTGNCGRANLEEAARFVAALTGDPDTPMTWQTFSDNRERNDPNLAKSTLLPCIRGNLQIGLGQYMRHAHEWLLLGTRGRAMIPEPANRMPSVIFAERTKHSKKPQEAYGLIERASPGPRLEMFAREPRDGWDVWGNEVAA